MPDDCRQLAHVGFLSEELQNLIIGIASAQVRSIHFTSERELRVIVRRAAAALATREALKIQDVATAQRRLAEIVQHVALSQAPSVLEQMESERVNAVNLFPK